MGRIIVAVWIALFVVMSGKLVADVIKVDPNTSGNVEISVGMQSVLQDERLVKPVTYSSGYNRLQGCLDSLSDISGIRIRTGANSRDWQVQDLPLVVCVHEMPLGKLLATIADCTHLTLSPERADDQLSYRVSRSGIQARQMQAFFDNRIAERLAKEEQGWDTIPLLAKVAPEQFIKETGLKDDRVLDYCKVVAELDPGIKDRVFSGENAVLEYDALPASARQAFEKAVQSIWRSRQESDAQWRSEHPGAEMAPFEEFEVGSLNECRLEFETALGGDGDLWGVHICVVTPVGDWRMSAGDALYFAGKINGLKVPEAKAQQQTIPAGYQQLVMAEGKWQSVPGLDAEVTLEKWNSPDDPTPADFMQALAKASGHDIVYEDFFSHSKGDLKLLQSLFGIRAKIIDFLTQLKNADGHVAYSPRWLYNDKDKILIGWAEKWQFRHRNLVQAEYYNRLKTLANTSGVELDDYLQIGLLTEGQRWDWFDSDRDLQHLAVVDLCAPVWKLYAGLSAEDKQSARSEAGLPLAKLGADVAKRVIDEQNKKYSDDFDPEYIKDLVQIPNDNDTLSRLSMRVKKISKSENGGHVYSMEVLFGNDVLADIRIAVAGTFPIYSPKREAELAKK